MDENLEEENILIKRHDPKKAKKTYIILIVIVAIITIIDQISKFLALKIGYIDLIPNFLNLHIAENRSGTYGIGSNSTFSYIITNIVVIAVLVKFILSQNEFIDTKLRIFLTLIVSGGFSNTIDRIFRGYVVEFIDFKFLPVLNISDIFIIIGWLSFIAIFAIFTINEFKSHKEKRHIPLNDRDKKSDIKQDTKKEK